MQNSSAADHVATIYRFCAQSMQYPSAEWLTEHYYSSLYLLLDHLGASEEKKSLMQAVDASSDALEDLQVEHTRLFINGVPHVAAPPYGSVYLEKTLRGKYSENILLYYRSHGFDLGVGADLPDSIVHQLEFLSFLAEDRNVEIEREFLARFFLPWFRAFAERVKQTAQHPFYRIIISLIDFFTKEEE
ncbi:TorD/DmsD family molecular chaperone [Desulforhopalus singaporensis]|uniref:Chaperone TorD involved in molybdoenzyme TorA maturation n=1 Tax=Desulforhopalus singaporensis TaxID=91360 RepID=A0A1H0PWB3_9BACT|nr:molecular chaperone TorD family protein [Desulforhopalus singaporensis]SDP09442.1 chaperone TorD involved in molybdoenzyme TorA maturation [Desulforhopalus singaporensis]